MHDVLGCAGISSLVLHMTNNTEPNASREVIQSILNFYGTLWIVAMTTKYNLQVSS